MNSMTKNAKNRHWDELVRREPRLADLTSYLADLRQRAGDGACTVGLTIAFDLAYQSPILCVHDCGDRDCSICSDFRAYLQAIGLDAPSPEAVPPGGAGTLTFLWRSDLTPVELT